MFSKCLRISVVAILVLFSAKSFAQIGQTRDSVLINAKVLKWKMTDSSGDRLQFFGDGVNYFYYFKDAKCYYNLVIANKLETFKLKEFLKIQNFVFQSESKSVEYAYVNEKMKAQATIDYEGKSVIIKIYPKLDFSEFHLKSDDSSKVVK